MSAKQGSSTNTSTTRPGKGAGRMRAKRAVSAQGKRRRSTKDQEERTFMKCLPPRSKCREPLLSGGRARNHVAAYDYIQTWSSDNCKVWQDIQWNRVNLYRTVDTPSSRKCHRDTHYRTICPCGMFNSNPLALRGVGVRAGGLFWMRPLVYYVSSFNVHALWKGNSSKQMSHCSWVQKCRNSHTPPPNVCVCALLVLFHQ